jgi:CRISPR-associated protein Cas1
MGRSYYLFKCGRLQRHANTLQIVGEDGVKKSLPVENVDDLYCFGVMDLNTKLLEFLGSREVPLHIFNHYGFYDGSYYPRERNVSGFLLVNQVEHYQDTDKRMKLAREFIRGAVHNLRRNLRYYASRGRDLEGALHTLEIEEARIDEVPGIAELMALEGHVRRAYYKAFNDILLTDCEFERRVRRPPDNMINALISFTNSLVYSTCLSQIYVTQLNPTISFLHEPGERRFSLALDLAEVFKPIIADKILFKLVNKQMLDEDDFDQELNCCYLDEKARKKVVQEFDERMETTLMHRRLKRHVSYRRLIRLECYKLVKHLTGIEPYQSLKAWW